MATVGIAITAMAVCSCARPDPFAAADTERTVQVSAGQGDAAKVEVAAPEFGWTGGIRPPKDKETTYQMSVFPGSLLSVSINDKTKAENGFTRFFCWYADRPDTMTFAISNFGATLNNQPVYLNLGLPGASFWLAQQSDSDLGTIQSVKLSGTPQKDLPALVRFRGSGVFITVPDGIPSGSFADYTKAFREVRPIGMDDTSAGMPLEDLLPNVSDVVYLAAAGSKLPSLGRLHHLRHLSFTFDGKAPIADVGVLKGNPDLRAVILGGSKEHHALENLQSLSGMKSLRSLWLEAETRPEDLAIIGKIHSLQNLTISNKTVPDLSALTPLQNLRHLTLDGFPKDAPIDLSPLDQLKNLKVLMVPKEHLEAHKKEYDALRAKRPDVEIIGFCMGSGWILAWLPVGLIAGLAWKRTRRVRLETR